MQADGAYDGFDPAEFPSRSGGKAEAVAHIKQAHSFQRVVMVGDGMTDCEARAPGGADAFIGCAPACCGCGSQLGPASCAGVCPPPPP